jgi:hypothetical protein
MVMAVKVIAIRNIAARKRRSIRGSENGRIEGTAESIAIGTIENLVDTVLVIAIEMTLLEIDGTVRSTTVKRIVDAVQVLTVEVAAETAIRSATGTIDDAVPVLVATVTGVIADIEIEAMNDLDDVVVATVMGATGTGDDLAHKVRRVDATTTQVATGRASQKGRTTLNSRV